MRLSPPPFHLTALLFLSISALSAKFEYRPTSEQRQSMQRETRIAINFLQDYHLKKMPFVEVDSDELLTNYMTTLDDQRLFFLASDHDEVIERFEATLKPSYLFVGDLYPAFQIYSIYQDRVEARLDWIDERLKGEFDLNREDEIVVDRADLPWPTDLAEADALWEKRLSYDIIAEILENETIEEAKEKIAKRYDRRRKLLEEFEIHNIQETFLSTLTTLYDPHSQFFSWDSAREFDIEISNSLIGIGAQLRDVEGYCVVERVLPGGPAELSGRIHPGDKIVAVAQGVDGLPVDVVGMKLRRVVHMIRGEPSTTVKLTIQSPDGQNRKVVSVKRDRIELASNLAKAELIEIPHGDKTVAIGVIELPSFYGEGDFEDGGTSTSGDVKELIERLREFGIQGLVLDLRRNGGGRLDEAVRLTGLFIETGPVVMKRSFDGQISEDWDEDAGVAYDGPLVVLTSRMSASASEIMAGALKSYNRAIVIGDESTYGKGTVQTLLDIARMSSSPFWSSAPQWGQLKLTIQQFYLPDGVSTQELGVPSDIVFPSLTESLIKTESEQPYALAWDQIKTIGFDKATESWKAPITTVSKETLDQLQKLSHLRQATLPEFEFFDRELEWRSNLIEKERFSLNLEKRRTEIEEQKKQRRAFEDERKRLSRDLAFTAQPVKLAVASQQDAVHQAKLSETPLPNGEARANKFFQKVFYYQADESSDIKEIWVEYIDYEKMITHAADLAQNVSRVIGEEMAPDVMESILTTLKNADRFGTFDVKGPFKTHLGETLTDEKLDQALPVFFTRIVELDEDLLRDRPALDIHLRESLRVIADWIDLQGSSSYEPAIAAAQTKAKKIPAEQL